ncbi:MAG: hypothetical protein ACRD0C_09235 [Acidimicrobiia bacterium]
MSRKTSRAAVVSLALGLTLAGMSGAGAVSVPDFDRIFENDLDDVVANDLGTITGDIEGGLGGLLGDEGLLGGILGGTDGLLGGLLGGLGLADDPDLEIQPVPSLGGSLAEPEVGGGLLDGLLGVGSLTESLAGHL